MRIFHVKSVKIYTGQKKFTRIYPWDPWQIWGMIIILWSKFAYVASLRICCGQPKYAKVLFPRPPSDAFRLLKRPEAFEFGNIRKWKGYEWFSNALVFPIFDTIKCEDFYHRRKYIYKRSQGFNNPLSIGLQRQYSWNSWRTLILTRYFI